MGKYNEGLAQTGILLAMDGLRPSSHGARVRFSGRSRIVSDGPFVETNELIAGFWMWKVSSLAEAIEWVNRCASPMPDDSDIEIRPVFEDFGEAFTPELREQDAAVRAQALGLATVTFQQGSDLLIAGLTASYGRNTRAKIPQPWQRLATANKALATVRRLLPPALTPIGAGPAARPAEAGMQEHAAGPKSHRPKLGTAKVATARDDCDPAKGAHAALFKLDRDDRERDR
jgi:hypothetical protein